jgi:hypothetical protein
MGRPSATKHLKILEAAVGEKLVRRSGRASALTEAGRWSLCTPSACARGATADALGYGGAIGLVAGLTAASGVWVMRDMPGTPPGRRRTGATRPAPGVVRTHAVSTNASIGASRPRS